MTVGKNVPIRVITISRSRKSYRNVADRPSTSDNKPTAISNQPAIRFKGAAGRKRTFEGSNCRSQPSQVTGPT